MRGVNRENAGKQDLSSLIPQPPLLPESGLPQESIATQQNLNKSKGDNMKPRILTYITALTLLSALAIPGSWPRKCGWSEIHRTLHVYRRDRWAVPYVGL